jgi:glycosyltransferase involved in cell wall biosynthesis
MMRRLTAVTRSGRAEIKGGVAPHFQSLTIGFPAYGDEGTVERVAMKALTIGQAMAVPFEVIIVDDGSPDRSGEIADELARVHPEIRVVHHETNLGYGRAFKSVLKNSRYDWIALTDGDDQYDLLDLKDLVRVAHRYDLIITFRYRKIYSTPRIFLSWLYNAVLRWLFRTPFRDVSTGLRLVHRSVIDAVELESDGNIIGAELAIRAMLCGFSVGEVGIKTFPRTFGVSSSVRPRHVRRALREVAGMYRSIYRN